MPTGHVDSLMPALRRAVFARQSSARTDGEVLAAFVLNADADAFAELVRRHGPMVLGVCRRVVGDLTTADDAFQAAFLVLARRAASVRPRERVGSWLYGVAYRTALKARTVLARRRSREKQVLVMPETTAPAVPAWTDLQAVIDEELARLPDKLRLPVVLCDLEGRPQREVAKHLNVPPATLATRLASARRTLATRLTRRGVTLSGGALAGLLGLHASAAAVPHPLAAGVVRAVEAVAAGGTANALVSAQAVQLSEGVIRMMMLAKLKAVAVVAAVALALSTGLGAGLVPAAADDRTGSAPAARSAPAPAAGSAGQTAVRPKAATRVDPAADDATFLRRLSLDVRGTVPTEVETWFFVSDADADKRAKVVVWLTPDDTVRAAVAKKLGVSIDRVRVVRAKLSADGRFVEFLGVAGAPQLIEQLAFTPDGKKLIMNERLAEVTSAKGDGVRWVGVFAGQPGNQSRVVWAAADAGEKDAPRTLRPWVAAPADKDGLWTLIGDEQPEGTGNGLSFSFTIADSDAEFLKRVLTDVRGTAPTALELKYFSEDKDPKKREKLIDTLLKDPAVQKKLGDAWKKKMLSVEMTGVITGRGSLFLLQPLPAGGVPPAKGVGAPVPPKLPTPPVPPKPAAAPQADKLDKLVGELIAAKKSDDAIAEAVTLATLGRLPTDGEKRLALAGVGTAADRKAAWVAVARALSGPEAKKPDVFTPQFHIEIVPPAKP